MKKRILFLGVFLIFASAGLLAQRTDLSGLKFCLDPGHGGHNASNDRNVIVDGTTSFWESESNFQKALYLKAYLEARGAWVVLTRYTNDYPNDADEPSLPARYQVANANGVDWYHSIHSNAFNASTNYSMVLLKENISTRQPAWPDAVTMSSYIYQRVRARDRNSTSGGNVSGYQGVYLDYTFYGGPPNGYNLGVLNGAAMPCELSEGSFHDVPAETRRLMNPSYKKNEAHAIYSAFLQYYTVPADNYGIVAGILTDSITGGPKNGIRVRVMPENVVYTGDNYNNGYYMIDSLAPGLHTVRFEKLNYTIDSVQVNVAAGGVYFNDRTLNFNRYPIVVSTSPVQADSAILISRSLTIQFSAVMDTATVRSAFSISPSAAGSLVWSNGNKTLTFVPSQPLWFSTTYTVQLNSAVRALSGYGLDQNDDGVGGDIYTFAFKTEQALLALKTPVVFAQAALNDSTVVQIGIRNRAEISNTLLAVYTKTALFKCYPVLPIPIAAGDSTFIAVSFLPQAYGSSFVDTLYVNSLNGNLKIPLSGASPVCSLLVSTKTMYFGSVNVGSSRTGPFYVTSLSANPVRVDSITLRTKNFQMSSFEVPRSMKIGDTIRVSLTFAPLVGGPCTDSVTVYNNSSVPIYRIALSGSGVATSVEEEGADLLPKQVALLQNYPNPFNPTTVLSYELPVTSPVSLVIIDMLGREVATLVNEQKQAGRHSVRWDASRMASGVYFYRLQTGSWTQTKKLILTK
jgi:N-acetylmuramoyl-L-alanine amidase